jgi:hypothetical protein
LYNYCLGLNHRTINTWRFTKFHETRSLRDAPSFWVFGNKISHLKKNHVFYLKMHDLSQNLVISYVINKIIIKYIRYWYTCFITNITNTFRCTVLSSNLWLYDNDKLKVIVFLLITSESETARYSIINNNHKISIFYLRDQILFIYVIY